VPCATAAVSDHLGVNFSEVVHSLRGVIIIIIIIIIISSGCLERLRDSTLQTVYDGWELPTSMSYIVTLIVLETSSLRLPRESIFF